MSFITQDFDQFNIITVLEGRTQAIIRNHFLRYDRAVRCRVKIITMDMFSPYYNFNKPANKMLAPRVPSQSGNRLGTVHPPRTFKNVEYLIANLRGG